MKKLFLVLFLCLVLTGCSEAQTSANNQSQTTKTATATLPSYTEMVQQTTATPTEQKTTVQRTTARKTTAATTMSVLEQNMSIVAAAESAYQSGSDYWDSVQPNYQPLDKNLVYYVSGGKSYHSTQHCVALLKSKNIMHTTLESAIKFGLNPCSKCVGD